MHHGRKKAHELPWRHFARRHHETAVMDVARGVTICFDIEGWVRDNHLGRFRAQHRFIAVVFKRVAAMETVRT